MQSSRLQRSQEQRRLSAPSITRDQWCQEIWSFNATCLAKKNLPEEVRGRNQLQRRCAKCINILHPDEQQIGTPASTPTLN